MGNSPQKPSALAATYGSDGYKNLPGSSSAGKKVEWVILNHNNHQREIDVYIYIYTDNNSNIFNIIHQVVVSHTLFI